MRTIATAIAVAALASGCGTLSEQRKLDVGAAELKVTDTEILGAAKGNTKREFLGIVVNDSVQKCADFLGRLTLEQQTINATGDISATVFSALATVFTPLSTVHALTGASTIASGTKASLMNALYAKASIANFSSALQQTYAKDIGKYIEGLDDLDESKIIVSNEVARIRAIHAECSLAQAEATVTSTLAAASQPGAQKPSSPIAVTKRFEPPTVKPNDKSKLTITLANSSDSPAILTAPFVDTFPATMTIASPLNLGGDCQHQSIDATASKGSLTFRSGATIPRKGCTI